jgi:hypothetical protein
VPCPIRSLEVANPGPIGIIFSVVAPLILPIGTTVFAIFWFAYSNTYIYDLRASIDTGGLIYWRAMHQLFVGVYVAELCLVGLFLLHELRLLASVLALALCMTVAVHCIVFKHYAPWVKHLPLSEQPICPEDRSHLASSLFLPPSLSTPNPTVWTPNCDHLALHDIQDTSAGLSIDGHYVWLF